MQDTDADWALWGEMDPYFGVLSQDKYRRQNLTEDTLDEFWAGGVSQMEEMAGHIRRGFGEFPRATALDFGCGVGRLTRGMARMCDHVVGLDVAPGMIAEAQRDAPENTEYLLELGDQTFDWVNSIIVFQHIPPVRGYAILEDLLSRINPGGVFSLHLTLYKDASFMPYLAGSLRAARFDGERMEVLGVEPSPRGAMMMYDYDMTRLIEITARHGFHALLTLHTNHGGCHGAILFGRKGA
ncbi:class I SAM-dependent methyltransferase [Brevundimonas staleyi]|uniref:Class I SAM-dependent methyltransferase n=1 Tax=Brevundimonas staleyi TaxID=74326 RepID=A0ABW0FTW6_9CAUL